MNKKEFLEINREYFKKLGFQVLKKSNYFYESPELFLQVLLTHSNFSKVYYIDFWISIKELHPEVNITNIEDCVDVQGRFGAGKYQVEVEYENIEAKEYISLLDNHVEINIIPIIKQGLRSLVHIPRLLIYNQSAYKYFKK